MVHFKGFDTFIESNEQDFIIYLNILHSITRTSIFKMEITLFSRKIWEYVKKYLVDKTY